MKKGRKALEKEEGLRDGKDLDSEFGMRLQEKLRNGVLERGACEYKGEL